MKTGARFWQLVGIVIFILGVYGLAELYDVVKVEKNQLYGQQQLISKQRMLLKDNHWAADLAAIDSVRQAWQIYLPLEDSVAVAKAHLLNDMRSLAQNAGMTNLSVTAIEVEENEKGDAASGYGNNAHTTSNFSSSQKKAEGDALPTGVQLIKVKIEGRFIPDAFAKLLRTLEEEGRFTIVERVSVRGARMELNLRYYWRMNASKAAATAQSRDASLMAATH